MTTAGSPPPVRDPDPLILTAAFDPRAAALFQELRERHFPPGLNIVPAHLTLFHHLPGDGYPALVASLRGLCGAEAAIPFASGEVRFIGRGVAIAVRAEALVRLRGRIAKDWDRRLTAQDRQGFRPHVTVQNKVAPAEARALQARLAAELPPVTGHVVGLRLWHYRGGPWEAAGEFPFAPPA